MQRRRVAMEMEVLPAGVLAGSGASRWTAAQSESDTITTDRPDAEYVGQVSALLLLERTTSHNLTGLIETLDAGWPQLKWQNDFIG